MDLLELREPDGAFRRPEEWLRGRYLRYRLSQAIRDRPPVAVGARG